jgi:hypothetical protein
MKKKENDNSITEIEIRRKDNGKSLKEMGFISNKETYDIYLSKNNLENEIPKKNILDEDGNVINEVKEIFNEWFDNYSENNKMDSIQLSKFTKTVLNSKDDLNGNAARILTLMKELDLIGLYVLVFVKSSLINYIKNFDYQIIKTGLKGAFGNKGSLLLRFNINDSKIALSCSHLSSGQDKNEERQNEIFNVLNTSFKKYSSLKFKEHDFYFYFGDLNSRLNLILSDNFIQDLIKNHSTDTNTEFSTFLQYDQLYQYQNQNSSVLELAEAPIRFSPTYKYFIGSSQYDTTQRVPSWCDRIFYKKYSNTTPLAYNKCILNISDHQPVYGVYQIKTEIIDERQKQMILSQIIKQKNMGNNFQNNNFNQHVGGIINQNDIVDKFF